jgi:NAD(P)-dependent dehydrogenase (short-subunit alcohol dehydrogenase family)
METKTIFITGANKGIGYETARQLLEKGFRVIISGRNKAKLTEAFNKLKSESNALEMILMDVDSETSINAAAQILAEQNFRIDVLINNAAILLREDQSLINRDFEIVTNTINTNCYGPLRVIRALLPLMKSGGRIINISSSGGSMSDPVGGWSPAYCVSKTMLNALTRQLALELSGKGISINSVTPGWVRTDMGGKSAPRTVEKGAETQVWLASEAPATLTGKFFSDKSEIKW